MRVIIQAEALRRSEKTHHHQFIHELPTIDAVPVVHGRWVYGVTLNHEWRKCSECLVSQEIFGCFTYCPNCGAKMDLEEDDK